MYIQDDKYVMELLASITSAALEKVREGSLSLFSSLARSLSRSRSLSPVKAREGACVGGCAL